MDDELKNGFYIVLPSNVPSVEGTGSTNKTSNYKTLMPRAIEVNDRRNYEVALVEICFPQSWKHGIQVEDCSFVYRPMRYNKSLHQRWLNELQKQDIQSLKYKVANDNLQAYINDTKKRYGCTRGNYPAQTGLDDLQKLVKYLNSIRPSRMRGKFYITSKNHLGVELQRFESLQFRDGKLSDIVRFRRGIAKYRGGLKRRKNIRSRKLRSKDKISDGANEGSITNGHTGQSQDQGTKETSEKIDQSASDPNTLTVDEKETLNEDRSNSRGAQPSTSTDETDDIERLFSEMLNHYSAKSREAYYGVETDEPVAIPPMSSNIYVYSDLVSETFVGNQYVPLLRTVPVNKENQDKYVTVSFQALRYLPLSRNFIEQIEIKLADEYGQNIRFEWGKVAITLHLRQRKDLG